MKNFVIEDFVKATCKSDRDIVGLYSQCIELRSSPLYFKALNFINEIIAVLQDSTEEVIFKYHNMATRGTCYGIYPFIDIAITDRCNLGCDSCSHYGPLCGDAPIIDAENLLASIELLMSKAGSAIDGIYLLGGEPTLHPDLKLLIQESRKILNKYSDNKKIVLLSNMIRYPNIREWLIPELLASKVTLGYSVYPSINEDIIEQAKADSQKFGFKTLRFGGNPSSFGRMLMNETAPYSAFVSKMNCSMSRCLSLRDKFLYLCPKITYSSYLNKAFNSKFEISKFDRISLEDVEIPEEILVLMNLASPFCKYCNNDVESIPWNLSSRQKSEWIEE